jgi:enamine deaminase RidA (YjgF/YER057c/UK114 family)
MVGAKGSQPVSAEHRLRDLGIQLPSPPTPFGTYVETVQTGNLLFFSGMLPVVDHKPKYVGRVGKELDIDAARDAVNIAALGVLAAAKKHLGSLDRVTRVVRLGVFIATFGDNVDQPKVADAASDLFRDIFGIEKTSVRFIVGVASLPLSVPIALDVIFEVVE